MPLLMIMNNNTLKLMPLLPFAAVLVLGILLGYYVSVPQWIWALLMSWSLIAGFILRDSKEWRFVPLLLCTIFVGAFQMNRENTELLPELPTEETELRIVVDDNPKQTDWGILISGLIYDARQSSLNGKKIRISWIDPMIVPSVGQSLSVTGKLRSIENRREADKNNAGNFNYEKWLFSHSYSATMTTDGERTILSEENILEKTRFSERIAIKSKILRGRILSAFQNEGLNGEDYAIVAAMGFGDKSSLTENTREVFSQTGAAHLLALSGMHLGILFVLISMFFSRVNMLLFPRHEGIVIRQVIVISTIWFYVILVGMPLSVIRSAIMLTIYAAISTSSRKKMSLNALAFTIIVMLLVNPMSIWDVGFQMSFLAMIGIFTFNTPIYNIINNEWLFEHPIIRKIWALVCVSLAAQITTMPLTIYNFGNLPVLFLMTNMVAIPLVTILLYSVFASLVFWFIPFVRYALLKIIHWVTYLLSSTLGTIAHWNISSINNISINWIQLMLIYLMIIVVTIIVIRMRKIYRIRRAHSILK